MIAAVLCLCDVFVYDVLSFLRPVCSLMSCMCPVCAVLGDHARVMCCIVLLLCCIAPPLYWWSCIRECVPSSVPRVCARPYISQLVYIVCFFCVRLFSPVYELPWFLCMCAVGAHCVIYGAVDMHASAWFVVVVAGLSL